MADELPDTAELADRPVEDVRETARCNYLQNSSGEGFDYSGREDAEAPGILRGPDTRTWEMILESPMHHDDMSAFDHLLERNGFDTVETHVGQRSYSDVAMSNQAVPSTLGLNINESYEEFMEGISHPFFDGMDRDEVRSPSDSDLRVGFGGYDTTVRVPTGFEVIEFRVPDMFSYADSVFNNSFMHDQDFSYEGLD